MKKIIVVCFVGLGILLSGCSKTTESQISFDDYSILLKTINIYREIKPSEKISQIDSSILRYYLAENKSGFQSSILIGKQKVAPEITLEQFATKIKNLEQNKITNKDFTNDKLIEIECGTGLTGTWLTTLEITNNKDILYMNQYIFIDKGYGYIISSMTDNKKENKYLISSFKGLSCKF